MMPDREKVKMALRACYSADIEWCQAREKGLCDYKVSYCRMALFKDAAELLEAQEPTPVSIKDSDGGTTHWYVCGSCQAPIQPGDNYCHECGKAVKWE